MNVDHTFFLGHQTPDLISYTGGVGPLAHLNCALCPMLASVRLKYDVTITRRRPTTTASFGPEFTTPVKGGNVVCSKSGNSGLDVLIL